jgi:arylsulfatase A-like enzyme
MTLLALAVVMGSSACSLEPSPRPYILLITLDTTRADRLGSYGYDKATSPNLDALAAESVVYTRAVSTTCWTLPGHATLMTGKLTSSHGARLDPEGPISLSQAIQGPAERYRARGLSPRERTLALLLGEQGYATAAVVASPWLKSIMGIDLGFESYDDGEIDQLGGRRATSVTTSALRWLRSRPEHGPFFLFLNYFDPHGPYDPPERFLGPPPPNPETGGRGATRRQRQSWRYDGEIRYMDDEIGRLFEGLRELGLYRDTWIFVVADHGESLGEKGIFTHGTQLDEPVLGIPFIVKYPGQRPPERREERVQLSDVLPTILDELGLPLPDGIQGTPIGRLDHPVVAEVYPLSFMKDYDGDMHALFEDEHKLIRKSGGRLLLYDLSRDPREETDLSTQLPQRTSAMLKSLIDYLAYLPAPLAAGEKRSIDAETRKALQELGYLE